MKKIIAFLLVAVMCLSCAACGSGSNTSGSNTKELLIGKWTCEREAGQDYVSQATVYTLELYKGGTCYIYNLGKENGEQYNNYDGTWDVKDDILTVTLPKATLGFVIDTSNEPYSLTKQKDNSVVLFKEK